MLGFADTTIENVKITLRARDRNARPSNTRVYGALDALVPELQAEVEKWTSPPVTIFMQRNEPEEAARIMAGYNKAKRAAVREAKKRLSALLVQAEIHAPVQGFSTRAGCACGCSPGFILSGVARLGTQIADVWVSRVE